MNESVTNRAADRLQALGSRTVYRDDYAPEVLETFENRHKDNDYWVHSKTGIRTMTTG